MRSLSDDAIAHLRGIAERPDLSETRYEVVREAGRGAMGVVYEVRDRELDRSVALKVMDADWRGEERIIASLEHPGIVPIHDSGLLPDGRFYYTMKLVRGMRLDAWSSQTHSLTERLRVFARICEPVAYAHAARVVHRDLKPENIMVGDFGAVLVMDWGVGGVAGTPGYMPPEATRDARSDVYALGAVLAFLVAEETVARPLRAVIERAMAADPEARYASAQELGADVTAFLDHEPLLAYRENFVETAARWATRYRALIAIVAAYLLMRTVAFFWLRL